MNTSTQRIDNFKNFEKELELIEKFNSFNHTEIQLIDSDDIQAVLTKKEKRFNIQTNARLSDDNTRSDKFSFSIDSVVYETKQLGDISSNSEFNENSRAKFSTTCEIATLQSQGFSDRGLYKAFYAVDLAEIKTFHSEFETITHQRDTEIFYEFLRINVDGIDYDVTQIETKSTGFYIFENLREENFQNYSKKCHSIKQAVGFINRLMVGGEEYVFDSSGNLYYSNYIRPTIKGMYNPIITNPYSYPDIERSSAEQFYKQLTRISLANLSTLVSSIHKNANFSVAILLILEATSTRSLLLIPSSFAVIIELLSKTISINETGLEYPIADKKIKNKIIEELHKVIDNNATGIDEDSIIKLKRRLNEINRPIVREHLTNDEKLTRPFEQLKIKLSLHDIVIIEHRNDLLHGNILLKNDDHKDSVDTNLYMTYVSAKLFTLISKLILKSIGYNGYVYNQAKYLEKYLGTETDDDYFERI